MQRVGLLNGNNITYDKDISAGILASLNGGIIEGFGISGSGASAQVLPGKALIECQRTNGDKVMVYFESTANVAVDMTGTKKVYVVVDQSKIDDGSLNNEDGTGIAFITTNPSVYPSVNFVKLYSITAGVPTDDKVSVKSKLTRSGLSAYKLLIVDGNGNETELGFGNNLEVLRSTGVNSMPSWGTVSATRAPVIIIDSQTIDSGVVAKDPVYYHFIAGKWMKSSSSTSTPTGIYMGVAGEIVLFGKVITSGLEAGKFYYLQDSGGIGTTIGSSKIKIGYANTATEFLIDIDVDNSGSVVAENQATKGYAMGGDVPGSGYSTKIDGLKFIDETSITPTTTLSIPRVNLTGFNSSTRGYAVCGSTGATSNEIDGILFSDETAINPSATMGYSRQLSAGINSTIKGYTFGGTPGTAIIDGFQFSTETVVSISAQLAVYMTSAMGVNSSTNGYLLGGDTGSGTKSAEIQGFLFSNESSTNPSAVLPVARYGGCGVNSKVKGYAMGGSTGSYSTEIDGILFSDESAINPSAILATARAWGCGVNSTIKGYAMGGSNGTALSEIDGLEFGGETSINPSAGLSVARAGLCGVQNGGIL